MKFAECIRAHGVPDFPDPDAKGEFDYGVSVSPAVWTRPSTRARTCSRRARSARSGRPRSSRRRLRFAQCIRENGVKDFPDPANGEPLVDTTKIPSSDRPGA